MDLLDRFLPFLCFFQFDSQQNIWAKLRFLSDALIENLWPYGLDSHPLAIPSSTNSPQKTNPRTSWNLVERLIFPAPKPSYTLESFPEELILIPHEVPSAGFYVEDRLRCVEQKNLDSIDLKGFEDVEEYEIFMYNMICIYSIILYMICNKYV